MALYFLQLKIIGETGEVIQIYYVMFNIYIYCIQHDYEQCFFSL